MDSSSASESDKSANRAGHSPEIDEDDDLLMSAPATAKKTGPAPKSPSKSHWGDDEDFDDIPDIDTIPIMEDHAYDKPHMTATNSSFFKTSKPLKRDDDSDEFDADDAVAAIVRDETKKVSSTHARIDIGPTQQNGEDEFDPDEALNELISNKLAPVSPLKSSVPSKVPEKIESSKAAAENSDSVSDWDEDSDSSDEEISKANSPQKETTKSVKETIATVSDKSNPQPEQKVILTTPQLGSDRVDSAASLTSDPNFLNLSVRERLQLRREALKQSRSNLSGSVTPNETEG